MPNAAPQLLSDAAPLSNNPPLAELLAEEAAPHRARADALIASLNASKIETPEHAAAVTSLGAMLADLRSKVELARKTRAEPFDQGKAEVQRVFKAGLIDVIDEAMSTARGMIDAWRRALDAQRAAEQRRRDEDAAKARAAAEEAERRKQEAAATGDTGAAIRAEMEEVQARDRAAALESDQGVIRPADPIRSHAGMATAQTQRVAVVKDLKKALAWLAKNQTVALIEAITPLVARLSRAKVEIPGVEVEEQQRTQFRR